MLNERDAELIQHAALFSLVYGPIFVSASWIFLTKFAGDLPIILVSSISLLAERVKGIITKWLAIIFSYGSWICSIS